MKVITFNASTGEKYLKEMDIPEVIQEDIKKPIDISTRISQLEDVMLWTMDLKPREGV